MRIPLLVFCLAVPPPTAFASQTAKELPPDPIERMLGETPLPPRPSPARLIFERGVHVEHHPNAYPQHEGWAPHAAANCTPDFFQPCARVLWNRAHIPEFGAVFTAHIPPLVRLHGPRADVIWTPTLHCMTYSQKHGQQWASAPGGACQIQQRETPQNMEWVVGGSIAGLDESIPGIYEGSAPLTVTNGDARWEMDVPIRYELYARQRVCTATASSGASIAGIPAGVGGTAGVELVRQPEGWSLAELVISGADLVRECETDGSGCGATHGAGTFVVEVTGATAQANTTIAIGGVRIGPAPDDAPWTHVLAYSRADRLYQITEARSWTISGADIHWNSSDQARIWIGGKIDIPSSWGMGTYSGTATVTVTCGS